MNDLIEFPVLKDNEVITLFVTEETIKKASEGKILIFKLSFKFYE